MSWRRAWSSCQGGLLGQGLGGEGEDRDAKPSKPRGLGEGEGWRELTFCSEICAPLSQVVDPLSGHTEPIFPVEMVARTKD